MLRSFRSRPAAAREQRKPASRRLDAPRCLQQRTRRLIHQATGPLTRSVHRSRVDPSLTCSPAAQSETLITADNDENRSRGNAISRPESCGPYPGPSSALWNFTRLNGRGVAGRRLVTAGTETISLRDMTTLLPSPHNGPHPKARLPVPPGAVAFPAAASEGPRRDKHSRRIPRPVPGAPCGTYSPRLRRTGSRLARPVAAPDPARACCPGYRARVRPRPRGRRPARMAGRPRPD